MTNAIDQNHSEVAAVAIPKQFKMGSSIYAKPVFSLQIPLECAQALSKCAAVHYDRTCRTYGSVLTLSWINTLTPYDGQDENEEIFVSADFRELDMLSKIIECPPPLSDAENKLLAQFRELISVNISSSKALQNIKIDVHQLSSEDRMEIDQKTARFPLNSGDQTARFPLSSDDIKLHGGVEQALDAIGIPHFGLKE